MHYPSGVLYCVKLRSLIYDVKCLCFLDNIWQSLIIGNTPQKQSYYNICLLKRHHNDPVLFIVIDKMKYITSSVIYSAVCLISHVTQFSCFREYRIMKKNMVGFFRGCNFLIVWFYSDWFLSVIDFNIVIFFIISDIFFLLYVYILLLIFSFYLYIFYFTILFFDSE